MYHWEREIVLWILFILKYSSVQYIASLNSIVQYIAFFNCGVEYNDSFNCVVSYIASFKAGDRLLKKNHSLLDLELWNLVHSSKRWKKTLLIHGNFFYDA